MLVLGAGGHAIEVLDIIEKDYTNIEFFDDVNEGKTSFENYKVISSLSYDHTDFVIGIGGFSRKKIIEKPLSMGLSWTPVVSKQATIGKRRVHLKHVDVMDGVHVSSNVFIGEGSLLNRLTNIHHGCRIGKFCEFGPGVNVLGNVKIGDNCLIGSGCVILPKVVIGNNVVIGAGAVVTKNIHDNCYAMGCPAREVKKMNKLGQA